GVSYDPASEVIATIGATQALDIAFRTLLTEGSEVVIPAPVYPGYEPVARLCGAKVLLVDTSRHRFRLSAALLEPYITPRTRLVVLPYPANPTGTVLSRAELAELAALLSQREVFVVSDEIYSELVFAESYASIVQFPGMRERTVLVQGLSKSHAMTGWRIGFVLAPQALTRHMLKVHQYSALCAPVATQYAALEALTHGLDDPAPMRETYRRRRDLACARLQAMGCEVVPPEGTFYVFPSIRRWGMNAMEFATRLLQEEHVAVLPGSAFSRFGEGFLRLSLAVPDDLLEEALARMERFVRRLGTP
ncbi:MAG: aminotransferase class I/II-fold pyridoxal phosphate-dependent enzyme, partial [Alicyclobacillus sp.]|nr:aminotransferase class I/II-fold pyridoxal phosphate-dependent enzyme [Alicyclobacillus sp.]